MQPRGAAQGHIGTLCGGELAFTAAPSLCKSQHCRTNAEYPRAPVDQANCLSPPHPVCALMPRAGQAAASFRWASAGMNRGWQGWGTFHTTITPGTPGSNWLSSPDLPPTMHRVPQADQGSAKHAPHTLLSTLHSLSPARQHPLCPPTLPKGHKGPWGEPGSGRAAGTHPAQAWLLCRLVLSLTPHVHGEVTTPPGDTLLL